MIVHSPLPERPQSLDEAIDRGYDPHDPAADVPGPPLDAKWQAALDGAITQAKALREQEATR